MSNADVFRVILLADGRKFQVLPDGTRIPFVDQTDWARIDALTDAEIEEMSQSDPDHPGTDDAFWEAADRAEAEQAKGERPTWKVPPAAE